MTDDPAHRPETVHFEAVIYPHRSLTPTGFLVVMGLLASASTAIGLMFFLVGAWPVVGFLGLDVLIVYIAFRLNFRAARAYEIVRLTGSQLEVIKVDAAGRARHARFPAYWVSVDLPDRPRRRTPLTLRSHGRRLEIASALTPDEKRSLAASLRGALAGLR